MAVRQWARELELELALSSTMMMMMIGPRATHAIRGIMPLALMPPQRTECARGTCGLSQKVLSNSIRPPNSQSSTKGSLISNKLSPHLSKKAC